MGKGLIHNTQGLPVSFTRLQKLYIYYVYDLTEVIAGQPDLQLLGICHFALHNADDLDDFWAKVDRLYQSPARLQTLPAVFTLNCYNNGITFIPSFYRCGRVLQACREIITSLSGWPNVLCGRYDLSSVQDAIRLFPNIWCGSNLRGSLSVSLLGISEENIGLFSETMEALVVCKDFSTALAKSTTHITITIHDKSIQVNSRLF